MSTRLSSFYGQVDDPREVELIRTLVEKTRQGKIPWVKQANALTATIAGGLQINFVLAPTPILTSHRDWQLLTVRDRSGSELVKVSNNTSPIASVIGVLAMSPLMAAANELYIAVSGSAVDDLDRAINTIKNL